MLTEPMIDENNSDELGEDGGLAAHELRWEKGVEFDLARHLQTWHILKEAHRAISQWPKAEPLSPKEVLKEALRLSLQPRYLPMAGNAEKTLGDAFGSVAMDKLILIECKAVLDASTWKREALGETVVKEEGQKIKIKNEGGKNRQATLSTLKGIGCQFPDGPATIESLGKSCHVLIGRSSEASPDSTSESNLHFANYWDFIVEKMNQGEDGKPVLDSKPISGIHELGLPLEKFRMYIYHLLDNDLRTDSGDAAWIGRELILLAYASNASTSHPGWIGGSVFASDLVRVLELDKHFADLLQNVKQRETVEARKAKEDAKAKKAALKEQPLTDVETVEGVKSSSSIKNK